MQYHRTQWFEGFCSAGQRTRLAVELVKHPLNELKEAVMNQLPVTASHPNLIIGVALTSNTGTKEKGLEVHDGLKKTVKTASKLDATGKPRKDYSWKAHYRQRRGQ
ncbi:hypothetical protein M0R45_016166 [Rubus argutus]|uniref:Uncharacterized protein n=1 Tax=Rubus argutus TaxID=59490 RepID=A0AAW1XSU6_RUBAR